MGACKVKDAWWRVDFGRPVEIDKAIIWIRSDFPHDNFWHNGVIEFSDGSRESIEFNKIAEPHRYFLSRKELLAG
jgi:hypothetical protein